MNSVTYLEPKTLVESYLNTALTNESALSISTIKLKYRNQLRVPKNDQGGYLN